MVINEKKKMIKKYVRIDELTSSHFARNDYVQMCELVISLYVAGFLAGEPASTTSDGVSGFFRLIKWLMSLGFASADMAVDEPAALDDEPAPLLLDSGIGFMNNAIWRFTSSNDCNW